MAQEMALGAGIAVTISIVAQLLWDRIFRRGALLDDNHCASCKKEIMDKIKAEVEERERVDNRLNRVARIGRVQTMALIRICQKMEIKGCERLEQLLEEGDQEEE